MSTKTQHTPGPWRISRGYVLASDKAVIATVFEELPEERANAALIGAAPELLEACRTAEANLSPAYSGDHLVMKRLRAAIAAAEGAQ